MFHDLNVPWTEATGEWQRTVAFLDECEQREEAPLRGRRTDTVKVGYDVVALSHTYAGKLPADLTSPIPAALPFPAPARLRILRRCNIFLTDAASNARIAQLQQQYDLVAARPTDERTLQQACQSLDVDIISLDLTRKYEKHFKFPTLGSAVSRGIKIELCYAQGILSTDPMAKRNLISNATQLIRVTRGRGLIFSSEASNVLGIRAPSDVINLASVWGLGTEKGRDGLTKEPRSLVEFARLKRQSFKGIVDIVYGGEKPPQPAAGKPKQQGQATKGNQNGKRAGDSLEGKPVRQPEESQPISKRQQKRNKKAKLQTADQ